MILGFKDFLRSGLNKQQSAAENNIGIPTAVMMAGNKTRGSNTGMMPTLQSDSHNGSERRTNDCKNRTHG